MNSQYFSEADVKNGLMTAFINELCNQSYQAEDTKNLILVLPEDFGAFTVHWIQSSWKTPENYASFEKVDCDEQVMRQLILPDNTVYWVANEEETKEVLSNWQKDHPTWDLHKLGWVLREE